MTLFSRKQFVLGLGVLASSFAATFVAANEDQVGATLPSGSCSELVVSEPENTLQWLIKSLYASHCYTFQARAVSIDEMGVRTLALSHRIQDGIRQQVVQHLDGPSVSVERRSPVGQLTWFEPDAETPASQPSAWAQHIVDHYNVELENQERVAGRTAVQISFLPADDQLYQHTWWVDKDTGLLLKHVLSDSQGRVLETFLMTQLQSPEPYDGQAMAYPPVEASEVNWLVTWLPDGFVDQPLEPAVPGVERLFYSDGLASISVFAMPVGEDPLVDGVHQIGVSSVAVTHQTVGEQPWRVVAIGEVPLAMLQRVAESVELH